MPVAPTLIPADDDDHPPQLLTVPQVAELLCISERQVKRLVAAGSLRSIRIGRLVRVMPAEVWRFISAAAEESQTP